MPEREDVVLTGFIEGFDVLCVDVADAERGVQQPDEEVGCARRHSRIDSDSHR